MKILTPILIAYTGVMLLIHWSSWKLLAKWSGSRDSWVKRWFPPQWALRVEALYWLFCAASWHLWPSSSWKTMVVLFAVIHVGIWLAGEFHVIRPSALPAQSPKVHQSIVAFDLLESVALAAIFWLAAAGLFYAG